MDLEWCPEVCLKSFYRSPASKSISFSFTWLQESLLLASVHQYMLPYLLNPERGSLAQTSVQTRNKRANFR